MAVVPKRIRDSKVLSMPVVSIEQWRTDPETGELNPPLRIRQFLEWYLDPERAAGLSLSDWARENQVTMMTVRTWLKDPRFISVLERRSAELNMRPDKTQAVIEAMWQKAVNGDVRAATLYLQHVGKLQPQRQEVQVTVTHVRELSDEQLQAEIQRLALNAGPVVDAEVVEG